MTFAGVSLSMVHYSLLDFDILALVLVAVHYDGVILTDAIISQ